MFELKTVSAQDRSSGCSRRPTRRLPGAEAAAHDAGCAGPAAGRVGIGALSRSQFLVSRHGGSRRPASAAENWARCRCRRDRRQISLSRSRRLRRRRTARKRQPKSASSCECPSGRPIDGSRHYYAHHPARRGHDQQNRAAAARNRSRRRRCSSRGSPRHQLRARRSPAGLVGTASIRGSRVRRHQRHCGQRSPHRRRTRAGFRGYRRNRQPAGRNPAILCWRAK